MGFRDYDRHSVRPDILAAHQQFWQRLSRPGCYFRGAERVAIVAQARAARTQPSSGAPREAQSADIPLSIAAAEAARTIAVDARGIDRAWFRRIADDLGEGAYVEGVAVTVQGIAVDAFATAIGVPLEPLPTPQPGEPDAALAAADDELADVGAFVPMLRDFPGPNVARALSLVPRDNLSFLSLVAAMYSLRDFQELVWKRPLSRTQVELLAARVSAVNECFY